MEDLNIQVLQSFKVKVKRIVKEKSYYICNTDKGYKVVRKSMDTEKHILFEHELKEHLWMAGMRNVDRFALSAQGRPFVEHDGNHYIMTELFDYREANFSDNGDFQKVVTATAQLHRLARKISFSVELPRKPENILDSYRKSVAEMDSIKKKIGAKRRLSDFDVIFIKNYNYYSEQMRQSLLLLEKTAISSKRAQAKQSSTVCHNLLKDEYILIDNSETFITGFSQANIDYQIFDLCSILGRYAKNLPRQPIGISKLLELYDRHNHLDREDLDILYPLLKFPAKYIKICGQYYSKNRTWTPNAIINRVEGIVAAKDRYDGFIEGKR